MIIDKISNIGNYPQIPDYVVKFIESIDQNVKLGRHVLSENEYVNVETYHSKSIKNAKFEAHNKYIDIQLVVNGRERIYLKNTDALKYSLPYNDEKDIRFFEDSVDDSDYVTLDGTNFILIYPHEAHAPQISINDECCEVKKVVVKLLA